PRSTTPTSWRARPRSRSRAANSSPRSRPWSCRGAAGGCARAGGGGARAPRRLDGTSSIADGLITLNVGAIPFAELERHRQRLRGVVLVEDDSIRAAVQFLWRTCRLAVEPSGAVTTAALLRW